MCTLSSGLSPSDLFGLVEPARALDPADIAPGIEKTRKLYRGTSSHVHEIELAVSTGNLTVTAIAKVPRYLVRNKNCYLRVVT